MYPRGQLETRLLALKERWGRRNPAGVLIVDRSPVQVWPVPGAVFQTVSGKWALWMPEEVNTSFGKFLFSKLELSDPVPIDDQFSYPGTRLDVVMLGNLMQIRKVTHNCMRDTPEGNEEFWKWDWSLAIHGMNPPYRPWEDYRKNRSNGKDLEIEMNGDVPFVTLAGDGQ